MSIADNRARDFKVADATSYNAHVEDFDRFTTLLTAPLAARLIAIARISTGQRVLDIGTGTGVVALEAAKALGAGGKCIGIDLSEKMLAGARESATRAGLDQRIEFKTMDAESLQFEAASFDVVVSLFALLHFPNPSLALSEMFRVLKPGGTLVVAVGSAPPWFSGQGIAHFLGLVPSLMARFCGRQLVAPKFLDRLVQECLPASDEPEESSLARAGRNRTRSVSRLVRDAGFESLRWDWKGHEAELQTGDDFWDIQRTFSSFARKRLNRATTEQAAAVKAKFDAICQRVLARGGQFVYPFAAFFVAAQRPSSN